MADIIALAVLGVAARAEAEAIVKSVRSRVANSKAAVTPETKPIHPSTADMVNSAIETLAGKNGSSLQAIKKYIAATYKLDTIKHASFIRKYLKSAVTTGVLVQTKGKGAAGSFKLARKKGAAKHKPKAISAPKQGSPEEAGAEKSAAKETQATTKASVEKPAIPEKAAEAKEPAVGNDSRERRYRGAGKVSKALPNPFKLSSSSMRLFCLKISNVWVEKRKLGYEFWNRGIGLQGIPH